METISKDIVSLLQYLIPGFISAWVFYAFTSYPKPSQFERVVQALIFTVFIQAMVYGVKSFLIYIGHFYTVGIWNEEVRLIWSILLAILLGLGFSCFANNDKLHSLFRKLRITRQTSYASEWFGSFLNNVTYVVLHLKDERRIYGWPIEWPSDPQNGHFLITEPSWLDSEGSEIEIKSVENILIDVNHVKWVEFMKIKGEQNHE